MARRQRAGFRPTLEVLEDRLVLSTGVAPSGTPGCLPVTVNFSSPPLESVGITFNGSPEEFGVAGQFTASVAGGPTFNALCVDLTHDVFPGDTYMVLPINAATAQSSGLVPMNAGEIAYLNDTYNTTTLSPIQGAGLQVAIWELEYGSNFQLVTANNPVTGANDTAAVQAAANTYIAAATGKSADATFYEPCAGTNVGQGLVGGTPQLTVTKTPDQSTITAGQNVGFTVTISNPGTAPATGVTLSDLLPAGAGNDIKYTINGGTTPTDFVINGTTAGSQSLGLSSAFTTGMGDILAPGQTISVHITGPTTAADVTSAPVSNTSNFNGTAIAFNPVSGQNNYIWFNSVLNVSGVSTTQPTTIDVTNQTITFSYVDPVTHAKVNEDLAVPNSVITFTPGLTQATLTFNNTTQTWIEDLPTSGLSGNVFSAGLAFKVPADGLPGGINPVTWTGSFSTTATGLSLQWQWAAAVYNNFSSDYNALGVKPVDSNTASQYKNSDHAGTPENFTIPGILPGGARGGGGSNWTGSYSGTIKIKPGPGALTNTATVSAFQVSAQNATATITISPATVVPQLALDSSSSAGAGFGELLGSSGLQTGTLGVAIDLPQGPQTAMELAAIRRAITSLDVQLAPLGIDLVEVSGADAAAAPIQISMASTTAIGGVDQGVLGAFTGTGDITLVSGWNWYFGSAASQIAANQYDFQTVVMHELGHALGLGESADPNSVMYLYLGQGQVQHGLTANDLSAIRQELGSSLTPLPASAVADPVLPTAVDTAEGLSPSLPPVLESVVDSGLDLPGSVAGAIDTLALLEPLPTSPGAGRVIEVNSAGTAPLSVLDLALQSFLQGDSAAQDIALTSSRGNEGAELRQSRLLYVGAQDVRPASASDPLAGDAAVDWLFSVTQDDGSGLPASGQDSGLSSSGGDDSGASGYDA